RTDLCQGYGAQASFGLLCAAGEYAPLFAAKRNDDLFVAAFKNYPAIFNSLDRNLVNLSADLEAELLTFRHGLAMDDRETPGAIGAGLSSAASKAGAARIDIQMREKNLFIVFR